MRKFEIVVTDPPADSGMSDSGLKILTREQATNLKNTIAETDDDPSDSCINVSAQVPEQPREAFSSDKWIESITQFENQGRVKTNVNQVYERQRRMMKFKSREGTRGEQSRGRQSSLEIEEEDEERPRTSNVREAVKYVVDFEEDKCMSTTIVVTFIMLVVVGIIAGICFAVVGWAAYWIATLIFI